MKDLRCLPYSEINKIASHSLIDAGGTHKTPGSETKDFITHRDSRNQSGSVPLGQSSKPQCRGTTRRAHSGPHRGRGALNSGNRSLLKQTAGYSLLQKEGLSLSFKGIPCTDILEQSV